VDTKRTEDAKFATVLVSPPSLPQDNKIEFGFKVTPNSEEKKRPTPIKVKKQDTTPEKKEVSSFGAFKSYDFKSA